MNIAEYKAKITEKINANGTRGITGPDLNEVLQASATTMEGVQERAVTAYLGIATTTTTPPPTGAYWYKVDASGTYMGVTVTEEDFKDAEGNYFDVTLEVKDGVAVKKKTEIPMDTFVKNDSSDFSIDDELGNKIVAFQDGHIITKNFDSSDIKSENKKKISILFLGNSFSVDNIMYVPSHLAQIAPDIDITIGILFYPSGPLETQWHFISNNQSPYVYYKSISGSAWSEQPNKNFDFGLNDEAWDVVCFQQQSARSRDYSTYQPYLNNILSYTYDKVENVRFAWIFTPALPTGGSGMPEGMTSNQFFDDMAVAVQQMLDETPIDLFFPVGAAIQNARTTPLNELGAFGQLSADGLHLNDGIACQITAYTVCIKICEILGVPSSVNGNKIIADASFISQNTIKQVESTPVGSTLPNLKIAQKAAIMAVKKPFTITNIN